MKRLCVVAALVVAGCIAGAVVSDHPSVATPNTPACNMDAASPWITHWFEAWKLVSVDVLHLPDAPAPNVLFYDSTCVYTTSAVSAPNAAVVAGPTLRGATIAWRVTTHDSMLIFPNGDTSPVQLMSFTNADKQSNPFFVMAAPSYWEQQMRRGDPNGFTGVFLHEFTHTRQFHGMARVIGPIDSTWAFSEELSDDCVQNQFGADSVYVAAYLSERDLLYQSANAESDAQARELAKQALEMMRARQARWFVGEYAVFATLDNTWLSMEGAAQWAAVAWLSHPAGGGMTREAAVAKMLGRRRWWSQDEGLALFLVIDHLLPSWPTLVFGERSMGATELLERAVDH